MKILKIMRLAACLLLCGSSFSGFGPRPIAAAEAPGAPPSLRPVPSNIAALAGITFNPAAIAFGNTGVGVASQPVSLTVSNNTASSIGIISSTNLDDFQFQQGTCGSLNSANMLVAGASCTFAATFTPTALGSVNASVTIGTASTSVTYHLSGTGVSAGLVFNPAHVDFGNIGVGTASGPTAVTVYNYSAEPAVLVASAGLDKFPIQNGNCGPYGNHTAIAVGGSCTFSISFSPTGTGTLAGSSTLGTAAHPVAFQVTGTGVPAGIIVNPATPGFGDVAVGTVTAPITVSISNYTATAIGVLSSSNLGKFNIQQGACGPFMNGSLLSIGGSCSYTVTFAPTVPGLVTATSTIGTMAHPVVITVTGTGVGAGPPVAKAGGPYTGKTGQPIAFDGSGSTAPAGQTLTYAWNFGDGSTGVGVAPSHTYQAAKSYNVSLTVTDTLGAASTAATTASVTPATNTLSISAAASPAPNAAGWNTTPVTVTFTCSDSVAQVTSCPAAIVVSSSAANKVISGTAKDSDGNTASTQVVLNVELSPPAIVAKVTPAANAAGWNNTSTTVSFTCTKSTSPIVTCPASTPFTTEVSAQLVSGTVTDVAGNTATASVVVKVDLTPPSLNVTLPTNGSTIALSSSSIGIAGTVGDNSSGIAGVTCNGTAATISNGSFTCTASLVSGANSIAIQATDIAGNKTAAPLSLTYAPAPQLSILSPANLTVTNITPVTVNGTISDPGATLTINGISVPHGSGSFSMPVPLVEGLNVLSAVATNSAGVSTTAIVQITLDTTPPHITIDSPAQGTTTTATAVTVSGLANDVVVGTVNSQDVAVSVNGVAAQVANRSYSAPNVPLALGANTIRATGRDRAGNGITTSVIVTRVAANQPPAAAIGQAVLTQWLNIISGNNQTGVVGTALSAPVVVSLTDKNSKALANQTVVFKIVANNGLVSSNGSTPASAVTVKTDSSGRAQVLWTLGQRSGAGNNMLEVSTALAVAPLDFTATSTTGAAALAVVDSGNNQVGILGQPLPFPLVVDVVDAGHNRVAGVPVVFTAKKGGGNFAGASTITITSDSNGRAIATLTTGVQEGINNNLVEANFANSNGFPAAFVATAKAPGNPADTTITGVVLDNSNQPVQGVTIHLYKTNQGNANNLPVQVGTPVQTDANGSFLIQNAPVGFFKLMADGATATGTKSYPPLEYDIVTVAGTENTVGMPLYLPALDTVNKVCVDETHGGTLTLPQYPGFALTVLPGSATFPGGSRTGCVTATPVNGDKVPMAPGFGQQPRFIVTIQPVGTTFNPPAPLTLPNVDGLKAKAVTEMYSYDHDLSMFVAIGTGTVTPDGSQIVSDQGVGVIKAGWHCGGDPNTTGSAGTCPDCNKCDGANCVADPTKDATACTSSGTSGVCCSGSCIQPTVDVLVNGTAATSDDITALNPAQTIPVKITMHSKAGCPAVKVTLSATPAGRVSFDQTDFSLADGASATATITPLAKSVSANDVTITATVNGVQSGMGKMTVVDITIPKIRNTDTPAALPDRIPPTANTPIMVTIMPDLTGSGQTVTLDKLNNSATNGDFSIAGGATKDVAMSGNVNLSGTTQTAATGGAGGGNAGKLMMVAKVRGQNAVMSPGFSVAAIPIGIVEAKVGAVMMPGAYGLIVSVAVTSDSGTNGDLSACQFSEQIEVTNETGALIGLGGGQNSSYLTCVGNFQDTHGTGVADVTGAGTQTIAQTHIFKDARLGTTDIPIDHSGYTIFRNAFEAPPASGMLHLTTSKVGAAVTSNGYSSSAGTPAVPMTVTQP